MDELKGMFISNRTLWIQSKVETRRRDTAMEDQNPEVTSENYADESKALAATDSEKSIDPITEVDERLVDEAVKFIKETVNKTLYQGSLEIGEYLLKNFFHDDIEFARVKNPKKPTSFAALCRRGDLGVHPTTLSEFVRVADQERFFRSRAVDTAQLTYTHRCDLVRLPNDDKKIDLLNRIAAQSLSTRELLCIIKEERRKLLPGAKAMPQAQPGKLVKALTKIFNDPALKNLDFNPDRLRDLDDAKRKEVEQKTKDALTKIGQISKCYKKLLDDLKILEKGRSEGEGESAS